MSRWFLWLIFWTTSAIAAPSQPPLSDQKALATLADILENPEQRQVLITELRKLSTVPKAELSTETNKIIEQNPPAPAKSNSETMAPVAGVEKSVDTETIKAVTENAKEAVASAVAVPKKMMEYTADVVVRVSDKIHESWQALVDMFTGRDVSLKRFNLKTFLNAARNLSMVILSALTSYYLLRLLFNRGRKKMQIWAGRSNESNRVTRRIVGIIVVSLFDAFALLLAYFIANFIAGYAVGTGGILSMQGAFFIRAFIILEGLKIAVRILFYPAYPKLRLIPCSEENAVYWNHWFSTLISLLGYGYLVAYKLININLSPSMGLVFSAILAVSAFIYGITSIIKQRQNIRSALLKWSEKTNSSITGVFLGVLGIIWHWLALGYFVMLLVLTLLRGASSLPFVLRGTLDSIFIIGGGILFSAFLTQYINHQIHFSPNFKKHLAGVEKLLNAYIPTFLRVVRFIVFLVVIFGVLTAWSVVDMYGWLHSTAGHEFIRKWSGVALIIFLAAFIWLVAVGIIEHRLSPDTGKGKPSARVHTLLTLFKSGFGIIIFSIATIMIMSEIGINIGPLIAGAGVLGLAVGFGAQKLVQDVITGIFFQIENAMNAGDIVTVDGITGTAEKISIRSVGIRDRSGTYHLIPFSNVTRVSNYMRGYANHLAQYGIAYRENIDEAIVQLKAAFNELARGEMKKHILEPISIHGVTELGDSAVMIQIAIKTTPGDQWAVGRAYNRLVKIYFDAAGIEIPFPHTQIYFGEDKNGKAPPLHVRSAPEKVNLEKESDELTETFPEPKIKTTGDARLPGIDEV